MTYVDEVEQQDGTGTSVDRGRFTRRTLVIGALPLAFNVSGQIYVSLAEDDEKIWTQVSAVVIASLLFGGIAFALAQWAMRGSRTRQVRTVVGLSVLTVLLVPVAWWSAAPALVGLQAWLLAQVTGVGRRPGASAAARAASIIAGATAIAIVVFVLVVIIAEQL